MFRSFLLLRQAAFLFLFAQTAFAQVSIRQNEDQVMPWGGVLDRTDGVYERRGRDFDIVSEMSVSVSEEDISWSVESLPPGVTTATAQSGRILRLLGRLDELGDYTIAARVEIPGFSAEMSFDIKVVKYLPKTYSLTDYAAVDRLFMNVGERVYDAMDEFEGWLAVTSKSDYEFQHLDNIGPDFEWEVDELPAGLSYVVGLAGDNPSGTGSATTSSISFTGSVTTPRLYHSVVRVKTPFETAEAPMDIVVISKAPYLVMPDKSFVVRQSSSLVSYEYYLEDINYYEFGKGTYEATLNGEPLTVEASSNRLYIEGPWREIGEQVIKIHATNRTGQVSEFEFPVEILPSVPKFGEDFPEVIQLNAFEQAEWHAPIWFYRYARPELSFDGDLPEGLEVEPVATDRNGNNNIIRFHGAPTESGVFELTITATNDFGSDTVDVVLYIPEYDASPQLINETATATFITNIQSQTIFRFENPEGVHSPIGFDVRSRLPNFLQVDTEDGILKLSGRPLEQDGTGRYKVIVNAYNHHVLKQYKFLVVVKASADDPDPELVDLAFGPDLVEYSPNFVYSPWFGFAYIGSQPWVYNFELGWMYIFETTVSDEEVWFYHAGNPSRGWMFSGSNLEGFFYFEISPGEWDWQWLYTGAVDMSTPENPPANP